MKHIYHEIDEGWKCTFEFNAWKVNTYICTLYAYILHMYVYMYNNQLLRKLMSKHVYLVSGIFFFIFVNYLCIIGVVEK